MSKNLITLILLVLFSIFSVKAQVTIGSGTPPKPFSLLELDPTNTKGGLRLPTLTMADKVAIQDSLIKYPQAALGLLIYSQDSGAIEYWDGTSWSAAKLVEPWHQSNSSNKASQNTQDIYQMGKVGIGTASTPAAKLEVAGDAIIRQMITGTITDSVVVTRNGLLRKVAQNEIIPTNGNFNSSLEISVTNGTGATLKNISANIVASSITTGKIADKAITTGKIADGTAAGQVIKWNGTQWALRPDTIVEPWQVSGGTTKASLNTENIYQMGRVGIGANTPGYMLDVNETNTTIDPMRIRTLLSGTTTDSIVSINSSGILKRRSVFNLRKDIVAPPVPTTQLFPGMIKYDATSKTMQYYDGTTWQIIASNALFTKNEGVVRINSGGTGSVTSFGTTTTPTNPNQLYTVTYTSPLTYGIAAWPENITTPTDANIYNFTNNRFLENPIVNQTHIWRVTLSYTKSNNILSQQIDVSLFNPVSNFRVTSIGTIASGRTAGSMTLYLVTVADANSIGTGYQLQWSCSDDLTRLAIDNVTRISTYKD